MKEGEEGTGKEGKRGGNNKKQNKRKKTTNRTVEIKINKPITE